MNVDVEGAIIDSILANSLKDFQDNQIIQDPEVSLATLWRVIDTNTYRLTITDRMATNRLAKGIHLGIAAIINGIAKDRGKGHIRELSYYQRMKIRLLAAYEYNS